MVMRWVYDDGGRASAGFRPSGDCVARAIAIATGKPYVEVRGEIVEWAKRERRGKRKKGVSSPSTGVYTPTTRKYLAALGWSWVPTMGIGTGCRVHLREGELPMGRLIVKTSKHVVAVIDGVIHDTHDPSRGGMRCVYGYYAKQG